MTLGSLAADHAACADALRRSRSNFALYAFCRRADDIVDDSADPAAAGVRLDAFERDLEAALAGGHSADPVIRAVVDTVRRFAVPPEYLRDILDGVRMDLAQHSYETFADLEEYCRRVASAVGLAAIHIWGFRTPEAIPASHACGMAFQLTNILRDIPEDLGRGRIYLPREDFAAHGCSPADLAAGRIGAEFARLASFEIDRADAYFKQAQSLDRMLSTDGRLVFRAMHGVYRALLGAVRRGGSRIFTERLRPPKPVMIGSAIVSLVAGPRA
jgi:phytoene synthase